MPRASFMNRCGLLLAALVCTLVGQINAGESNNIIPKEEVPEGNFRFLAVADPHFWELEKHPKGLNAFKAWLQNIKPLKADFAVILGDVCGDRYAALPQARKIAEESGIKVHFLPGNHDDAYGNKLEYWKKAFGKFFYSFDHKGWHIVSHWSQKPQPKWLAADLAKVKPGTPTIFWQHYQPGHSPAVFSLLEKHQIKIVLSGHVHGLRTGMRGKIRDANLNTFGRGFAVVDVLKDGRIALEWRPRHMKKCLVIEHPAQADAVAAGEQKILVTAFDSARDVVSVEYNAGAGWKPLQKKTGWSWTAKAQLRGGQLQVRVKDSAGEDWTATSKYTIGNPLLVKLGANWPVWGGTPENRRCAKSKLTSPLQGAWQAQIGGRLSQPVLADGRLFVNSASQDFEENNMLVCLDALSGKELWRAPLASNPMGSAAVSGKIVGVVDGHGRAYGFDVASGKELWRASGLRTYGSGGASGKITAADGIFLAGNAQAIEAHTGKKLWPKRAPLTQYAICPPAISGGQAVGAGTGWQRCLEIKTGKQIWKSPRSTYRASVAINDQFLLGGRSLVGSADGKTVRGFKMSTGSAGAVSSDGRIFVAGNHPGRVVAQDLTSGKHLWSFPRGKKMGFSAACISGSHVWVWSSDRYLRAISLKTGKEIWKRRFGAKLNGPIISGNTLFISGNDGCLHALVGQTK
jgi:outer membrane protein assembly factor BamB/calcineurin-like phosphoesterase family protein